MPDAELISVGRWTMNLLFLAIASLLAWMTYTGVTHFGGQDSIPFAAMAGAFNFLFILIPTWGWVLKNWEPK